MPGFFLKLFHPSQLGSYLPATMGYCESLPFLISLQNPLNTSLFFSSLPLSHVHLSSVLRKRQGCQRLSGPTAHDKQVNQPDSSQCTLGFFFPFLALIAEAACQSLGAAPHRMSTHHADRSRTHTNSVYTRDHSESTQLFFLVRSHTMWNFSCVEVKEKKKEHGSSFFTQTNWQRKSWEKRWNWRN